MWEQEDSRGEAKAGAYTFSTLLHLTEGEGFKSERENFEIYVMGQMDCQIVN